MMELRPVYDHKLNTVWKYLGPEGLRLLGFDGGGLVGAHRRRSLCRDWRRGGRRFRRALDWCRSRDSSARTPTMRRTAPPFSSSESTTWTSSAGSPSTSDRPVQASSNPSPTYIRPSMFGPLTPALGLFIAAQATPNAEGTGSLYGNLARHSLSYPLPTKRWA